VGSGRGFVRIARGSQSTVNPSDRLQIPRPDQYQDPWHAEYLRFVDIVDRSILGNLYVSATEWPSASRQVIVRAGAYVDLGGVRQTLAQSVPITLGASSIVYLWLAETPDAGLVGREMVRTSAAFPASEPYIPLAIVTVATNVIAAIDDARIGGFRYLGV
jgi:hypothetical protein